MSRSRLSRRVRDLLDLTDLADRLPKKGVPPGTVWGDIARGPGRRNMLSWTNAACGTGDDGGAAAPGDIEIRTEEDTGGNCQRASLCHESEGVKFKYVSMRVERSVTVLENLVGFGFSTSQSRYSFTEAPDGERDREVRAVTNEADGMKLEMRVVEESLRWILRSALNETAGIRRSARRTVAT